MKRLKAKKVQFRCLHQSGLNADSSTGRLMLAILGAVAAFEADIRKEWQADGIAKTKGAVVYKNRKPNVDAERVRELHGAATRSVGIARELCIGRAGVYRALGGAAPAT